MLVLDFTHGAGGAEHNLALIANALSAREHTITIVSQDESNAVPAYSLSSNVKHVNVPSFYDETRLSTELSNINPDVILFSYFRFDLVSVMKTARKCNIPIVIWESGEPNRKEAMLSDARFTKISGSVMRKALLTGAHGIRLTLPEFISSIPAFHHRWCEVIDNPFFLASAPANQFKKEKWLISIGGLKSPVKNGMDTIEAFALVAEEFSDWGLKIFGPVKEKERVISRIAALGLQSRIKLAGVSRDIYGELQKANLHIITSLSEANPNVVGEAMCNGIPTIGYADCAGVNARIQHNKNGMLATRSKDHDSIVTALRTLMSDDTLRFKLGQNAYEDARSFSPAKVFSDWEALLCNAARYKGNSKRLVEEHKSIDAEITENFRKIRESIFLDWEQR